MKSRVPSSQRAAMANQIQPLALGYGVAKGGRGTPLLCEAPFQKNIS